MAFWTQGQLEKNCGDKNLKIRLRQEWRCQAVSGGGGMT